MSSRKKRGANKTRKGGSESSGEKKVRIFCCSDKTEETDRSGTLHLFSFQTPIFYIIFIELI
uniref:Uncharacterized protein n=1 Tax=viral metagenome TaxID=1070528 RepID=A0A6C0H1J0_9ZZZZ